MKVLFVNPMSGERPRTTPCIGLGYLASLSRDAGHEASLLDCAIEGYGYDDFERHISEHQPDLVGIRVFTADLVHVRELMERIHRAAPAAIIIIGGPHPSMVPPAHLYEDLPSLTFAVAGEGEPGFVRFLDEVVSESPDFSSVPNLIWRGPDGTVTANPREMVEDLDTVPFPAWDLIQPDRYTYGFTILTSKGNAAPMAITRGCPFRCTFCGAHLLTGRTLRKRSVDNVIEEMKLLKTEYGIQQIDIIDENFAFDRAFVLELCERMIREEINLAWNCPQGVRLDRLDPEMIHLMEEAGCFELSLGIESGSNRILKGIKKSLTVETVVEQVNMIRRESKIALLGLFMMGLPDETVEDVEATIKLACSLPLDLASFESLRVMPGSEIYSDLLAAGRIPSHIHPDEFGRNSFRRSYCQIPDDDLFKLYRKAYTSFYLRPRIAFNLLRRVRTLSQVRILMDGMYRYVRRPVSELAGNP